MRLNSFREARIEVATREFEQLTGMSAVASLAKELIAGGMRQEDVLTAILKVTVNQVVHSVE